MKKTLIVIMSIIIVVIFSNASKAHIIPNAAANTITTNADRGARLIIVHKRIGDNGHKYDTFAKITNREHFHEIENLLGDIQWENAKVLMERTPDYTIDIQYISTAYTTLLWISSSKEIVELVIREQNKYVRLDKEKSTSLLELITDMD